MRVSEVRCACLVSGDQFVNVDHVIELDTSRDCDEMTADVRL